MASASSKDLKARVVIDTKNAIRSLTRLENKIKAINRAINTNTASTNRWNTSLNRTVTTTNRLRIETTRVATATGRVYRGYQRTSGIMDTLISKAKRLASAYLGVMGAKALIRTSDVITSAENRLNNLPEGSQVSTQTSMDKMYVASQNARTGYADMIGNVSKSMTLAGDAFQGNIDNAIRFQEIMAKAYTVGGASAAEQSSSMYQMIQALGAGVLQGDELRSVREGAPIAYKEIEKFAQGVYNTTESLKEMASQGKITSDMVVAAIMNAGESIDSKFENTSMTFAQAWQNIKNTATKAFEPVLQMMNDGLKYLVDSGVLHGIGVIIQAIAQAVEFIFSVVGKVFKWFIDNWYWIQFIVYAVITAILIALGILATKLLIAGVTAFISFLMGLSPLYMWILVIGLIIAALVWLAGSIESLCGWIVGILLTIVAVIFNIISGVIDGIIQFLWTHFVEPWIGIIEWVLNVFNGGFNTFGDGVKNLLGNIISWFLSLGQVVTKIIDAIFGTDWTGALNSLKDKVLSWGKNDTAITLSREAPSLVGSRIPYGEAFRNGYNTGYSGGEWLGNKLNGAGFNIGGDLNNKLNNLGDIGTLGDYSFDPSKIANGVDDTAGNTKKMADAMDLTQEDLEYLRRVADMEWKKEFTTATIQVDMSNYNTVNGDSDLDGIVTKLADKLYEELDYMANGVYA